MFTDNGSVDVTRLQPVLMRQPRLSPGQFWTKWLLFSAMLTIGYLIVDRADAQPTSQVVHVDHVTRSESAPQLADVAYAFQMRLRK